MNPALQPVQACRQDLALDHRGAFGEDQVLRSQCATVHLCRGNSIKRKQAAGGKLAFGHEGDLRMRQVGRGHHVEIVRGLAEGVAGRDCGIAGKGDWEGAEGGADGRGKRQVERIRRRVGCSGGSVQ